MMPDHSYTGGLWPRHLDLPVGRLPAKHDAVSPVGLFSGVLGVVMDSMFCPRREDQILAPVVQLDPVDVMNNLSREQMAPEFFLQNQAMFCNVAASDVEHAVAVADGAGSIGALSFHRPIIYGVYDRGN